MWGPSRIQHPFAQVHGEHDAACLSLGLSCSVGLPPFTSQLRKLFLSATFILHPPWGPEATRGTWAFGHLPRWPASSSGLYGCGPAARRWDINSRDPIAQDSLCLQGTAGAEFPGPTVQSPPGALYAHPVLRPLGKSPELFSAPGAFGVLVS